MKNNFGLIINIFLLTTSFSQVPCILSEVYVSEAANQGNPVDYIEVYNDGNVECNLLGFQLDDSEDLEGFTFGNVILAPGDYWLGYENACRSFNFGLGGEGDTVWFANTDGNISPLVVIIEESKETENCVELSQSYESNGTGCYTLPTPGESNADCYEFNVCLLGDLNDDGEWNILDIVQLSNCILTNNCDEYENGCAGDFNSDSYWNVLDIVQLTNCVLTNSCGDRVN